MARYQKGHPGLVVLGVFTGVVLFVVTLLTMLTGLLKPVVDASESFLTSLARSQVHQAYLQASSSFRQRVKESSLAQYAKTMGLKEIESFSWSQRSLKNDQGKLKGQLKLKGGQEIPVRVLLVLEAGDWKIQELLLGTQDLMAFQTEQGLGSGSSLDKTRQKKP